MKDVTKIISERATRFLPVDMKDRLKSAFNRNVGNAAPASQSNEDVPDYGAIFNANKTGGNQKKSHFAGPLDQTQLAEPTTSQTMRNPGRQIANDSRAEDGIEEAEIVTDPTAQSDSTSEASSGWESASLKTNHKVDTPVEAPRAEAPRAAAPIADDVPDYSAIFKGSKPRSSESAPPRPHFEASPTRP